MVSHVVSIGHAESCTKPPVFCFFDDQNPAKLYGDTRWGTYLEQMCSLKDKIKKAPKLSVQLFAVGSGEASEIICLVYLGKKGELTFSSINSLIASIYSATEHLGGANIFLNPVSCTTFRHDGSMEELNITDDCCADEKDCHKDEKDCHKDGKGHCKEILSHNAFSFALSRGEIIYYALEVAATIGYKLTDYKTGKDCKKPIATLSMVCPRPDDGDGVKESREFINGYLSSLRSSTNHAKELILSPPNVATPEYVANKAAEILEPLGVSVKVLSKRDMEKKGFGSMLGVAQGSINPPVLLVMEWCPTSSTNNEYDLALVGKGVTFDSGGLSLKSSEAMQEMKIDMSGAAVVIGLMEMLSRTQTKARVVGLAGLVENMPSSKAQRPSDIVTSLSGKTIEVMNTDAEGRLVLADVVWYAQTEYNVKKMIDFATLTGAVVQALGTHAAACMGNDDQFVKDIIKCGIRGGEPMWQLPIDTLYSKQLESAFADVANISLKGYGAGTITAAQFIKHFVKNDTVWAHIDIAGSISASAKYVDNSIRAFGIKSIYNFIKQHISKDSYSK